jgi:uncharacterized membrane protein YfcA
VTYAVVCTVAFVVSLLSFFSGFGLGTLLLPVFALFFPIPTAVAATAVVHLASNVFKLALVGRQADAGVVVRFALPAAAAAIVGASVLGLLAGIPPLASYDLGGQRHEVTAVKATVSALMLVFALVEVVPGSRRLAVGRRWLVPGGVLSGFFGGLSGHQGALRSVFLVNAGLDERAFVGTSVVAAVLVDVARLSVYGTGSTGVHLLGHAAGLPRLVGAATLAAFLGSIAGARLLGTVTMRGIRLLVAGLLIVVAVGLGSGLV